MIRPVQGWYRNGCHIWQLLDRDPIVGDYGIGNSKEDAITYNAIHIYTEKGWIGIKDDLQGEVFYIIRGTVEFGRFFE